MNISEFKRLKTVQNLRLAKIEKGLLIVLDDNNKIIFNKIIANGEKYKVKVNYDNILAILRTLHSPHTVIFFHNHINSDECFFSFQDLFQMKSFEEAISKEFQIYVRFGLVTRDEIIITKRR